MFFDSGDKTSSYADLLRAAPRGATISFSRKKLRQPADVDVVVRIASAVGSVLIVERRQSPATD